MFKKVQKHDVFASGHVGKVAHVPTFLYGSESTNVDIHLFFRCFSWLIEHQGSIRKCAFSRPPYSAIFGWKSLEFKLRVFVAELSRSVDG